MSKKLKIIVCILVAAVCIVAFLIGVHDGYKEADRAKQQEKEAAMTTTENQEEQTEMEQNQDSIYSNSTAADL